MKRVPEKNGKSHNISEILQCVNFKAIHVFYRRVTALKPSRMASRSKF